MPEIVSNSQDMSDRQEKEQLHGEMVRFARRLHESHRGEEKTVTVRGVDKTLYDQFVGLTKIWKRNIGFAFSQLIGHYGKDLPFIFSHHLRKRGGKSPRSSLEIIEGLEELIITKNDLTEAGERKFVFKSIKKLVFDEEIDNKTLLDHVQVIKDCTVKLPKKASSLVFHSLIRQKPVYTPIEENLKDITIRNVRKDIYDDFVATCQLQKRKIGEAVNELLVWLVPAMESRHILVFDLMADPHDTLVITSLDNLAVTGHDLAEIKDRQILFHRIRDLEFAPDVEKSDFIDSVIGVYNCEHIKLPPALPRLFKYSRVKKYPR
ncbi:MAG: hypothetical protein ACFFB3_22765 [Candidatus Hodarchaeota archaeon]